MFKSVLISLVFITKSLIHLQILSKIAIVVSILNLVITLSLCYKDVKDALIRKFHM